MPLVLDDGIQSCVIQLSKLRASTKPSIYKCHNNNTRVIAEPADIEKVQYLAKRGRKSIKKNENLK